MSPLQTGIGIAALICSMITSAFVFYHLGRKSTFKISIFVPYYFLFSALITLLFGIGLENQDQNALAVVLGNVAVIFISYVLGKSKTQSL
ncbi:hypothetical protein A2572_03705 [Candidatus Collierbacteria bacterium RIFOXYD1_FULL_40_9]|uniref:Uncharacterized protein n=1 Tax=Candidatus Collierbacteria bacterium RIFOXYD1_FULL_40_9 TaxID=1817731 RepID=A0A1F5FTL6_9BACT|nr:MAG: hypothetical protein A2572_03705 [Candidatus Collierbacteria bacterium RIFOXYD1_FULL_40_9]